MKISESIYGIKNAPKNTFLREILYIYVFCTFCLITTIWSWKYQIIVFIEWIRICSGFWYFSSFMRGYVGQADREAEIFISTSSIPIAEIGETPNVAEADSEAETGKEKLNRIVPLPSVRLLLRPVIRVLQVLAEKWVILPDTALNPTV